MSTRKSAVFYGLLIALTSLVVGMVIASRLDLTPLSTAAPLNIPATNSAPLEGSLDASTFRNIVRQAGPSVVSITTTATRAVQAEIPDLFGLPLPPGFGGNRRGQNPPVERPVQGAGSGFIIDKSGYILTNNHVVEGATAIEVRLSSMDDLAEGLPAKVVGRDELTDTALLQLIEMPKDPLVPAAFGDSAQMAPGDWVMAIGNPFNLSNTVTVGVVSAVGRQTLVSNNRFEDFIQTDAAINRGNSGGPLLNIRGEVIGINTMIVTDGRSEGNVGVGFAVPIDTVRDLLPQLHEGKVTRGRIGVMIMRRPMTEEYARELGLSRAGGAEIQSTERGGPADKAGIKVGDVIIEFNGKEIRNNNELVSAVAGTRPGTTVPLKVVRDRKTLSLNVTVAELNLDEERRLTETESTAPSAGEPQETELGMEIRELTARDQRQLQLPAGRGGAVVTDVTPFGAAANAGIAAGDVILSVQGNAVTSVEQVTAAIKALPTGRTARLIIWRQGQEMLIQVRKR